jgi:hypothetical protein
MNWKYLEGTAHDLERMKNPDIPQSDKTLKSGTS